MTLAAGTRVGVYEVVAQIGAGGMGEVYRARDTLLNRDVALKVLPEAFSRDGERMARFDREARLLASLNHPNIAAIYGLEESGPIRALVMELVEGPTLAERVHSGAIPIDEALPIARQVADAVEYAHDKNVIHRDLKPANIKVTPEGTVKVLDFGLAKALSDEPTEGDMSNSPTLSMAATRQGVILGTAAYMSPEQAKGKTVDRRTDVWAFGAVLYEMLTSKQPFPGEDITEVLAAVVRADPEWKQLPANTPPAIRNLLRRCLEKNLRRRLGHISEARILLEDVLSGTAPPEPVAATRAKGRERLAWAAALTLLVSTTALSAWVIVSRRPPPEPQAIQFSVGAPGNGSFSTSATVVSVSPDGNNLVFTATESPSGPMQLWIRRLDSEVAQPLPGTENGGQPFWSPDSRFVAFYADSKLKKTSISGGLPQTLAETGGGNGATGSWNREGVVLFTLAGDPNTIHRVSSAGGQARPVTTLDASRQETAHFWAEFLPDGNHFLYLARSSNPENNAIYVASLDSPERKMLLNVFSNAVYVPPGYLLFHREETLMAQAFDAERLELTGEEVPIAEDVQFTGQGKGAFHVSENGVLAYRAATQATASQLTWFDRTGKQTGTLGEPALQGSVELSPDGRRASVNILDRTRRGVDIWIYDVARGLRERLTFDAADEDTAVWSPDGSRVVFRSNRKGPYDLYLKAADGSGVEEPLLEDNFAKRPGSWSSDGRFLLFNRSGERTGTDLFVLPLSGDRKPAPFLQTPFSEWASDFSPDGRWVAYRSDEGGPSEVYVAPFPGPGGKRQVSNGGGEWPRWRADGTEIFYRAPDNTLIVAAVNGRGSSFEIGSVRPLFQIRPAGTGHAYAVTADGQRFLINTLPEQAASAPITVVVNWAAGLQK